MAERQSVLARTNWRMDRLTVRSGTRHQIYYFWRMISQISKLRMWSSMSSLLHSKLKVKHEETLLSWACCQWLPKDDKFVWFSQIKDDFQDYHSNCRSLSEPCWKTKHIFVDLNYTHPRILSWKLHSGRMNSRRLTQNKIWLHYFSDMLVTSCIFLFLYDDDLKRVSPYVFLSNEVYVTSKMKISRFHQPFVA